MYIDLAALWQSANAFFNSNAFTAIAGSCAGAYFGAHGAQRIAERSKEREELLTEIRNTNAAIMVAFAICNSFLIIKKQHIKPFKYSYDAQKAAYLDHAQKRRSGQISTDTPFKVNYYAPICLTTVESLLGGLKLDLERMRPLL